MKWKIIMILTGIAIITILLLMPLSKQNRKNQIRSQELKELIRQSQIEIRNNEYKWTVTKSTGEESQLTFWTLNGKDKKTELGWIPPNNSCIGWTDKYLYDETGRILDDKNKDIMVKCESAKCGGRNCYHISLTDIQAINIDDYVKIGENSIIAEYQDQKKVEYISEWFSLNATLFIETNGDWNNTINNIFVYDNPDKKKFGANVTGFNETRKFKYLIESDSQIFEDSFNRFYLSHEINGICGGIACINEERHIIDLSDICSIKHNETWYFNPRCEFSQIKNIGNKWSLEVDFYSEYNITSNIISIDPEINIGQVNQTASTKNNVTCENYPLCHVTVNDSSLIVYLPFDVSHTTSTGSIYDYSPYNNDVSQVTTARWVSNGYNGGGVRVGGEGTDNYLTFGSPTALDDIVQKSGGITIMMWIKIGANYGESSSLDYIIGKGDAPGDPGGSWRIGINPAFQYLTFTKDFSTTDLDVTSTTIGTMVTDVWEHIAVTYKNGTTTSNVTFYINGVVNASSGTAGVGNQVSDSAVDLYVGANLYLNRVINATYDEIMIFNRTLSSAEITSVYNNQLYKFKTPSNQVFNKANISELANLNRVNITTNITFPTNTNITLRLLEYNRSGTNIENTSYIGLNSGNNQITTFAINSLTTNVSLDFNFSTDAYNFFSPILKENIIITSWTSGEAPPTDNEYPIFYNYWDNNATLVGSGNATFSVRINNTNTTVFLEINNTNYTASFIGECYQEFANSTSCGQVIAGNYTVGGGAWNVNGYGTIDGDWTTSDFPDEGAISVYSTYLIPENTASAIWQYKGENGSVSNLTVNPSCLSGTALSIQMALVGTAENNTFYCWDGSQWFQMNTEKVTLGVFYEEAVYWNISAYNVSVTLSAGTYNYYWGSYGNGTNHNYNTSGLRNYVVNLTGDSCTCPDADNWEIDMSDNCQFNNPCSPLAVTFINTGNFYCNSTLNASSIGNLKSGQEGWARPLCRIIER